MPITNHIRDNWCRFQGELFPEIQDAVGPLLKKYGNYIFKCHFTSAGFAKPLIQCPISFVLNITFMRPSIP